MVRWLGLLGGLCCCRWWCRQGMACDTVGSMWQEGRGSMLAVGEWGRGGWGGERTWFSCETRTCIPTWDRILGAKRHAKRVFANMGKGCYSVKGMSLFVEAEGLKLKSLKWSSNTKGNVKIPKWEWPWFWICRWAHMGEPEISETFGQLRLKCWKWEGSSFANLFVCWGPS